MPALAAGAATGPGRTLLVYTPSDDVLELAASTPGRSRWWRAGPRREWFATARPGLPEAISVTVVQVEGETNTDDLLPATQRPTTRRIRCTSVVYPWRMLETRMPAA